MAEQMDHERLYLSLEKAIDGFIIRTEKVVDKLEGRIGILEEWKEAISIKIAMNTKKREEGEQLGQLAKGRVISIVITAFFALVVIGFLAWVALYK